MTLPAWQKVINSLDRYQETALLEDESLMSAREFRGLASRYKKEHQALLPLITIAKACIKAPPTPEILKLGSRVICEIKKHRGELARIHFQSSKLLRDALFALTPPKFLIGDLDRKALTGHLYKNATPGLSQVRASLMHYNSLLKGPKRFDIYADSMRVLMRQGLSISCPESTHLRNLIQKTRKNTQDFFTSYSLVTSPVLYNRIQPLTGLKGLSFTFPDVFLTRAPREGQSWVRWHRENMYLLAKRALDGKSLPGQLSKVDLLVFLDGYCSYQGDYGPLNTWLQNLTMGTESEFVPMPRILSVITAP